MSSMKARLLTSAIGVPLVILVLILCEQYAEIMYIAISCLCTLMTYELLSAKKLHKKLPVLIPCVAFSFVEPLMITTEYRLIPIYIFALVLLFVMLMNSEKLRYSNICFALVGVMMIVLGMSSVLMISAYYGGYTSFAFILALGIAWLSDSGAYFSGVFLGKHKLCPKVSPNKTVEGFVGGLITGTIACALVGLVYTLIYKNVTFDYLTLVVLGFFGSLVSVLGDLTFSQIKRSCGIKDYGSLFPGHGGMLDRFDSVIFVAPLAYIFCTMFPLMTVTGV